MYYCGSVFERNVMKEIIVVRVPDGDRAKIERLIKREYPKMKTISDVVRAALTDFLIDQ